MSSLCGEKKFTTLQNLILFNPSIMRKKYIHACTYLMLLMLSSPTLYAMDKQSATNQFVHTKTPVYQHTSTITHMTCGKKGIFFTDSDYSSLFFLDIDPEKRDKLINGYIREIMNTFGKDLVSLTEAFVGFLPILIECEYPMSQQKTRIIKASPEGDYCALTSNANAYYICKVENKSITHPILRSYLFDFAWSSPYELLIIEEQNKISKLNVATNEKEELQWPIIKWPAKNTPKRLACNKKNDFLISWDNEDEFKMLFCDPNKQETHVLEEVDNNELEIILTAYGAPKISNHYAGYVSFEEGLKIFSCELKKPVKTYRFNDSDILNVFFLEEGYVVFTDEENVYAALLDEGDSCPIIKGLDNEVKLCEGYEGNTFYYTSTHSAQSTIYQVKLK